MNAPKRIVSNRQQWWSPPREASEDPAFSMPFSSAQFPRTVMLQVEDCEGLDWVVEASGFARDRSSEAGILTTLTASEIRQGGRPAIPFMLAIGWAGADSSLEQIVGIGAGLAMTIPNPKTISVSLIVPQGAFQNLGGVPTPNPPRGDSTDFIVNVNARPTNVSRGTRGVRMTLLDLAEDEELIRPVPPFADELEVQLAPAGTTATAIGVPSIRLNRGNDLNGSMTVVQVPIGDRIVVPDCAAFYQVVPDPDEAAIVCATWRLVL